MCLFFSGQVVGRKALDLRICACPSRDRRQEERKAEKRREDDRTPGVLPTKRPLNSTNSALVPESKKVQLVVDARPQHGTQGRNDPRSTESYASKMMSAMQDAMQLVEFLRQRHPDVLHEYEQL